MWTHVERKRTDTINYGDNLELRPIPSDVKIKSHNIENKFTSLKKQGIRGACTSFAIVSAVEFIMKSCGKLSADEDDMLSERFLYYYSRLMWKNYKPEAITDSGVPIEFALQAAATYGIATEAACPYYSSWLTSLVGMGNVEEPPSDEALASATHFKIKVYKGIAVSKDNFKAALYNDFPVIVVMLMNDNTFPLKSMLHTGMAVKTEIPFDSSHACVLVGFDDEKQVFKFRNSWDSVFFRWGDGGYGYIPYELVGSMIEKAWIITGFSHIEHPQITDQNAVQDYMSKDGQQPNIKEMDF